MTVLYILIPVAMLLVGIAILVFNWAVNSGQYDDLDKEAWKILADDEPPAPTPGPAAAEKSPGPEQTQ